MINRISRWGAFFSRRLLPNRFLVLLSFFAIMHILHLVYFIVEIQPSSLPDPVIMAYMLGISAGTAFYFWGSSVFLYLPYAHGSEMSPSSRFDYMCLGVGLNFFFHEFPLGWLQIWLATHQGVADNYQGIMLCISLLSFLISLWITWFAYSWKASELLQSYYIRSSDSRAAAFLHFVGAEGPRGDTYYSLEGDELNRI